MSSERELNQRRSLRLTNYDYAQAGFYFVTLCTHQRQCLFGKVSEGLIHESPAGLMVKDVWKALPTRFSFVDLDDFVIMPNHLHGLLRLKTEEITGSEIMEKEGRTQGSPLRFLSEQHNHPIGTKESSLGRVVQAFKSLTTHGYTMGVKQDGWPAFDGKIWQRDYHDHIVRDEVGLNKVRHYIAANPGEWEPDEENPYSFQTP